MSSTLATDIESFVMKTGRVSRCVVYGRFELVAKRVIDQALESLAQSRRLSVGALDVAPIAKASPSAPKARVRAPRQRKRRARPPRAPTRYAKILALFEPGHRLLREEILLSLSEHPTGSVDQALKLLTKTGQLRREKGQGYWLGDGEPPPHRTTKEIVIGAFLPGERLKPAEVRARVPNLPRRTITRALCYLRQRGRLQAEAFRGYWLPGTIEESAST